MAVNPKELKALQKQWDGAQAAAGGWQLPDGVYEFVIVKAVPDTQKWGMKVTYRVTGGNESFIGEEGSIKDNLDTDSNMGWFKKKLARLGISLPTDVTLLFSDSTNEDSVAAQLIGKKFEGQARNKDEFLNVYVNRLIGEADPDELNSAGEPEPEGAAEEGGEATQTEGEITVGAAVSFTTAKGEDLEGEVMAEDEDGKYTVEVAVEGGKARVFHLPADRLTVAEAEAAAEEGGEEEAVAEEATEEEAAEAEEPAQPKGRVKFPKPKLVGVMKLPELKALLAKSGFKLEALRQPRDFAAGVAGFVHEKNYMPEVKNLAALAAGLGVRVAKGAKPALVVKELRSKALARFAA